MSQSIQVNGQTINYPETGDTNWADDATNFAIQTSAALGKIGLSSGTSVDITQTLDVTGNTSLDANLSVGGNTTLTGNLTVNGNTQLGNANTDSIGVTGIVNIDSGVLYVDPVNSRVGINDTTPSQALDVTGNVAITGNETVGGTLGVTGDVAINTNKFNVTASSGNTTIAGTLGISNGTALAPAITPSGDTNTGLYSINADKIGFAANGVRQGEFGVGYGGFTGNIIQVVSTTKSDTFSTTPTVNTWTDITGLSVSITPIYTSSKILVMYHVMMGENSTQLNHIRLVRGSTAISIGDTAGSRLSTTTSTYNSGQVNTISINSAFFLDSPSTTSSTTYKLQLIATAPSAVYINRSQRDDNASYEPRGTSSITVMEVQQ